MLYLALISQKRICFYVRLCNGDEFQNNLWFHTRVWSRNFFEMWQQQSNRIKLRLRSAYCQAPDFIRSAVAFCNLEAREWYRVGDDLKGIVRVKQVSLPRLTKLLMCCFYWYAVLYEFVCSWTSVVLLIRFNFLDFISQHLEGVDKFRFSD